MIEIKKPLDIRIGDKVNLIASYYGEIKEYVIEDIHLSKYIASGYHTILVAKTYDEKTERWYRKEFFANEFIEAMIKARDEADKAETAI